MDKNIGKKLDGRYEITELIGVGGMADVYKGVDIIDNKSVAIKILKKEFAENEEFLRRFRNESKAIAVLSHPNIVKIYDVGFSDKIQYIVMEYIDGITLKDYIEEEKVLTWKDTVHFIIQILRALQHAHEKGIIHRDIKPQNIMMFTDGTIKVMDFGIAKFAREQGKTATDQAIGSVHYISPEQAKGDVTDQKSDIYSVGAMMYEMLAGRKPFDSDSPVSIAVMHMQDIPDRPRAVNPEIPAGLEEIILKAMEKAPENRYQSTSDMIADIEAFKANPDIDFGYYNAPENENAEFYGSMPIDPADNSGYGAPPVPPAPMPVYDQRYTVDQDYDDEDDDDEEEERSSLVVPVLTATVVVVIIVAVIFVASLVKDLLSSDGGDADFKMPNLIGMDYNEAVSMYGDKISIQENGYEYNEMDTGCIISQDPEYGTESKKGDTVKVVISRGVEKANIPVGLVGLDSNVAKARLEDAGFVCEIKHASSTEVDKDKVIKTVPEEGTEVEKGMTVVLYVSMGLDSDLVEIENYVGKPIEEVTQTITYLGLDVQIEREDSYEDEGIIFEQSILPGEKVEVGTPIILKVSTGIEPEGEMIIEVPIPSNANGRFIIDFIVQNPDGTNNTFSTTTIIGQEMSMATIRLSGSGESVPVRAVLTNSNNQMTAILGEYRVNFADKTYTRVSEDIAGAFTAVGGFNEPTTEPQTEPPTPAPTEPPTQAPTEAPTEAPTQAPTQRPTTPPNVPTMPPQTAPPETDPPVETPTDAPVEAE